MGKQQKIWETPQLIILARGMPEENVLTVCKSIDATVNVGPTKASQTLCGMDAENCAACQSRGGQNS